MTKVLPPYTRIEFTSSSEVTEKEPINGRKEAERNPSMSDPQIKVIRREALLHYANTEKSEKLSEKLKFLEVFKEGKYQILPDGSPCLTDAYASKRDCYKELAFRMEKYGGNTLGCNQESFVDILDPAFNP